MVLLDQQEKCKEATFTCTTECGSRVVGPCVGSGKGSRLKHCVVNFEEISLESPGIRQHMLFSNKIAMSTMILA